MKGLILRAMIRAAVVVVVVATSTLGSVWGGVRAEARGGGARSDGIDKGWCGGGTGGRCDHARMGGRGAEPREGG